jgi:signal transduction histidine kinase
VAREGSVGWRTSAQVSHFDLAIGGTIAALTELEIWLQDAIRGGDRVVIAATLLIATVTLCWRRSVPLTCATAIGGALAIEAAITGIDLSSAGWALAVMVALYSAAAYSNTRRALLGFLILLAGLAARELRNLDSYSQNPMGNAFWWLLTFSWFGVGLYVRSRRRAGQLGRVAVQVEVDSAANARFAVVEERARIAQELHDVVAQDVSAVLVQAEAAEELLNDHPDRARESLQTIQRMSREALGEMRHMLGMMRDGDTEERPAPQPTLDQLPDLIERHEALGLPAELRVEGTPRPLPPGLEVSAYRVVQESLANVRKHAGGVPACVTVTFEADSLELEIADDGGDVAAGQGGGHGLLGMQERVRFFGGRFTAGSRPDGGFVVHASFPTPASSER